MKKTKTKPRPAPQNKTVLKLSPEQAIDFLESIQALTSGIEGPSKAISIRVPENLLRAYKLRAKADARPYQSMMIEALRRGIRP